jgi:hypothetical protein
MLLASFAAGLVATWPFLILYSVIGLFANDDALFERFSPPIIIGSISAAYGIITYFPYSLLRRRYEWTLTQDLRFHILLSAVTPITVFLFQSRFQDGLAMQLFTVGFVFTAAAVIALPSPLLFSYIIDNT